MTDFTYDKRHLWRYFEVNGLNRSEPTPREDGRVFGGQLMDHGPWLSEDARWEAWLNDSLLWTIEMLESGQLILGFRGFIQATEYREHLASRGGANASDTWQRLNATIQEQIERLMTERDYAIQVLSDKYEEGDVPWPARRTR